MFEKYGLSEASFIEAGKQFFNEKGFEIQPYHHRVIVCVNLFEWDAVAYYLSKMHRRVDMIQHSDNYAAAGGFTMQYYHIGNGFNYTMLGLHGHTLKPCSHQKLVEFISVMAHEIQHVINHNARELKYNPVVEDEPVAYTVGMLTERVLGIVARSLNLSFIAMPRAAAYLTSGLAALPLPMIMDLSARGVHSACIRQRVEESNHTVIIDSDTEWRASTYLAGLVGGGDGVL